MAETSVGEKIKKILEIDLSENIRSAMVAETTGADENAPQLKEKVLSMNSLGTLEVDEEGLLMQSLNDIDHDATSATVPSTDAPSESAAEKIKTRISYYVPILGWLPQYDYKSNLVADIVAGLGVAAMLIPQSLAYAILARLPPSMGLYTAFFPVILYFFLGTSRQLSIGPDALSSLLVGIIMAERELDNPHEAVPALAMIVGIILFALGIIRVGFLDNVLSRPLLCGFVNAVAVTIIMEQSDVFFGIKLSGEHKNLHGWHKVVAAWEERETANGATVIIGLITIALLLLNRFLKKRFTVNKYIPEPLVAVVLGIAFNAIIDFTQFGVTILGEMKSGFEAPRLPKLEYLERSNGFYIHSGILVGVIGFIEHIVIAKLYASKYNYQISPNRELVALGVSNFISSFFGTYPTFGSLPRSGVADSLGAKSELFSIVTAAIIGISILFLGPVFYYLPRVVMSAIILVASLGLFELHDIFFLWGIRAKKELFLLFITFACTVVLGIELGIAISLLISVFLIIKHTTFPNVNVLGVVPGTNQFREVSKDNTKALPGVLIVRIEEPLYFANVAQIKRLFARIEKLGDPKAHPSERINTPPTKVVIIHMRNVISIDASAVQTLEEMIDDYNKRHIHVMFVKVRDLVRPFLFKAHIVTEANAADRLFNKVEDAVKRAQELTQSQDGMESGLSQPSRRSNEKWRGGDTGSSNSRFSDMSQVELE